MAKGKNKSATGEAYPDVSNQPASSVSRPVPVKYANYSSEGVEDHDVFLLPGSDYQILLVLTLVAAIVRVFRIYQPSSVVFDEVQYVSPAASCGMSC
jgi:dolichyl-phosphate-mannose-protein mannosyltransferase